MGSFIAIYRNQEGGSAKLIAVGADPGLVAYVAGRLITESSQSRTDAVAAALEEGRAEALRAIRREALDAKRARGSFRVFQASPPDCAGPAGRPR